MNEKCFQFYLLGEEVRKSDGTIESSRLFAEYGSEAEDAIDALLSAWGINATEFFWSLDESNRRQGIWPWAIALYEKEFRLAGHVASLRQHRDDFSFNAYSMHNRLPIGEYIEEYGVPPFSFFLINNKAALTVAAKMSPLFEQAWRLLKDKEEGAHWVCIASSPPDEWVAKTGAGDDELFLRTIGMA